MAVHAAGLINEITQSFNMLYEITLEVENGLWLRFNEKLWSIYGGARNHMVPGPISVKPMGQVPLKGPYDILILFSSLVENLS